MSYTIDAAAVTGTELRHRLFPGKTKGRQVDGFPGLAQQISKKPPVGGKGLLVTMFLHGTGATVADAITALHQLLQTEENRQAPGSTHSVGIYKTTLKESELVAFDTISDIIAVADSGGTSHVKQRVRWQWSQLKPETTFA